MRYAVAFLWVFIGFGLALAGLVIAVRWFFWNIAPSTDLIAMAVPFAFFGVSHIAFGFSRDKLASGAGAGGAG